MIDYDFPDGFEGYYFTCHPEWESELLRSKPFTILPDLPVSFIGIPIITNNIIDVGAAYLIKDTLGIKPWLSRYETPPVPISFPKIAQEAMASTISQLWARKGI
jgi:hypothetical protein